MTTATAAAEFKVTTKYDGWEDDERRIHGKLRVPPETTFRPYSVTLAQARECAAEHGVQLEVRGE
jgi:hypothetical protein